MSSIAELSTARVYRAFQTVVEMCEDRGYTVTKPRHLKSLLQARWDDKKKINTDAPSESSKSSSAACITYPWFRQEFVTGKGSHQEQSDHSGDDHRAYNDPAGLLKRAEMTVVAIKESNENTEPEVKVEPDEDGNTNYESKTAQRIARECLVVFFTDADPLPMKEIAERRYDAAHRFGASRVIIVAPRIPGAIRRETAEGNGSALLQQSQLTATVDEGRSLMGIADEESFAFVELFEEQELVFNPLHHKTVPKHIALSEVEIEAVLRQYRVSRDQLPRISSSDPIVRYFGETRGAVFRIIRESNDSGPYDMYRQVI